MGKSKRYKTNKRKREIQKEGWKHQVKKEGERKEKKEEISGGVDLFAVDQQGEAVEQAVDGVSRLVDGQDDGAAVVCHPEETGRENTLKSPHS